MSFDRLKELIEGSERLVFFGGAGVSTESNIPDFRSSSGIYSAARAEYIHPPEVMLSHTFFMENTAAFYQFYKEKLIYPNAKPNPAHTALAALERRGLVDAVITQNVDGLHQMAGSSNVIELHGSVHRNYCMDCGDAFGLDFIMHSAGIPRCPRCGGIVKPDVVLYEEPLSEVCVRAAAESIRSADTLIIGGTSLAVYPAAGLVQYYKGSNLVLINKTPTQYDRLATLVIHKPIGEVLGNIVE